MIVGHAEVVRRLLDGLPPVSLFVGPRSVGRKTLATMLAEAQGLDVVEFVNPTMEDARSISRMAQMGAQPPQLFIIEFDGRTHATVLDALLKALEEPAPTVSFVLITPRMPRGTISSRAEIFEFTLLTEEEVEKILLRRNFAPSEAKRLAGIARGQVVEALRHAKSGAQDKVPVLQALQAMRNRDEDGLSAQAVRWTEEHTTLLGIACREILTERWRVFQQAEVEGTTKPLAMRMLYALRADVRPRLVVHSSLMTILKENR